MKWKKPKDELPPQGLKILYWYKGDCWVAYRFGKYWFPVPFTDAQFATYSPPEKWATIDFPPGFEGRIYVYVDGEKHDIDQLELIYPSTYEQMLYALKSSIDDRKIKNNPR